MRNYFGRVFKGFNEKDKSAALVDGNVDLESERGQRYLADCFREFDTNGDRKLQPDEIYNALKKADKTTSYGKIYRIMREFDTNHDGEVDFNEFKNMVDHL